jgi:2-dehydropantoate 2-reductase
MQHAILGAGGVGGLIAGVLTQADEQVTLVVRPETAASYPATLRVQRPGMSEAQFAVPHTAHLQHAADVLWITVKATHLEAALRQVPRSPAANIIPLLNGIDHVELLRSRYGHDAVIAGTIAVESERVSPGHIIQHSPFLRIALGANAEPRLKELAAKMAAAGCGCEFHPDELTMLWIKLAFLAPFALVNTASGLDLGGFRSHPHWGERFRTCMQETCAVAVAAGAKVSLERGQQIAQILPLTMRSSMQRDVYAHRMPELDAIAGPIIRGGAKYGVPVPVSTELVRQIEERWKQIAPQGPSPLVRAAAA